MVSAVKPGKKEMPVLAARKRFGRFKDEKVQPVRNLKHEHTPGYRSIMEAWMEIVNFPDPKALFHSASHTKYYCREAIEGREYSGKDITNFSIALAEFVNEPDFDPAPQFLNVLTELSGEKDFLLYTAGWSNPPESLLFRNTKNIEIAGDAGLWLGREMQAGQVIVRGNAGNQAGDRMTGGLIIIEGDAGPFTGTRLEGGTIIIKGNAGKETGNEMLGDRLEVFGDAGDCVGHDMKGGEIEIHKNAGDSVGLKMKGGKILIHGNVGDYLGGSRESAVPTFMSGSLHYILWGQVRGQVPKRQESQPTGEIIVMGNAGEHVGENMKGGTIRIYGTYKSLGQNIKGNIYHGDRLIYERGSS